jgi:hydroxymethylpyrimidine kinase/phosphomethylpyrimidine kinase
VQPYTALTIAGSDSGGGAGIQADLRTFSAFEVHGTCAITAVTAQNTVGVQAIHVIEPSLVVTQVRSVLDDFDVVAVKTGMLAQPATIEAVAALAREGELAHLVVDPVLVSSTGHLLLSVGGVRAYREALLPYAEIVTPNLAEAAALADAEFGDVRDEDDMVRLARVILALGPRHVLVKGGHFAQRRRDHGHAPDVLVDAHGVTVFDAPRVDTDNDHGTGCSLSAAIAVGLGLGREVEDATRDAKSFVLAALTSARTWRLGRGRGPIDHLGWNA